MDVPLQIRDDGLWAHVRFTPRAAGYVQSGEYRFCSAVWMLGVPDRITGKENLAELHSVALTNVPFVDGLTPIFLEEGSDGAWIHVAKEGAWQGHPTGEFEITRAHMECAVSVALKNKTPLVLDYHHQSLDGDTAPAAGWIQLSRGNVVALANGESMDATELVAQIAELLGLPKDAGPEEIKAAVEGAALLAAAQKGETGASADAQPFEAIENARLIKNEGELAPIAEDAADKEVMQILQDASGLTDSAAVLASLKEHASAIGEILKATPDNGSPAGDGLPVANSRKAMDVLALTRLQLAAANKRNSERDALEFEDAFTKKLTGGYTTPASKEVLRGVFANSREEFNLLTSNQIVPMSAQARAGMPKSAVTLTATEESAAQGYASARRIPLEQAREEIAKRGR